MSFFIKAKCQQCGQPVEYDESGLSPGQSFEIDCPHCLSVIRIKRESLNAVPPELRKRKTAVRCTHFKNPANGHIETVYGDVWIVVLLFGCFYFIAKGIWTHAVIGFLAALLTCGVSWLIYPAFAEQALLSHYRRLGWIEVKQP